jgi:hypothetical protein
MMKMCNLYKKFDLLAQDVQLEALAEAEARAEVQIKDKAYPILVTITKIKIFHLQVIT